MKNLRNKLKEASGIMMAVAVGLCVLIAPKAYQLDHEDQKLLDELVAQGYDSKVAFDEIWERKGQPDVYGTGGIDGICQYGTYASSGKSSSSATSSSTKHTHSWGEGVVTKEASCSEKGVMTFTCSCGKTKETEIPTLDHTYAKEDTPASCTEYRKETYTCSCGDTYTIEFPEEGYADHIYIPTEDSYDASCTEPGKVYYVCNCCGDAYEEDIEPLGHSFTKYTIDTPPSCKEEGAKSIYCDECGEMQEGSTVVMDKTPHKENPAHEIKPATFWKDGLETVRCVDCEEILSETVLSATGGVFRYVLPAAGGAVLVLVFVLVLILRKKK